MNLLIKAISTEVHSVKISRMNLQPRPKNINTLSLSGSSFFKSGISTSTCYFCFLSPSPPMILWGSCSCMAPDVGRGSRRRSAQQLHSNPRRPRQQWGLCWAPCWCLFLRCGSLNRGSPELYWQPNIRQVAKY